MPPILTQQPVSQSVTVGATVQFIAVAEGTEPLHYQWLFNETTPIAKATNAILVLSNVQTNQSGSYAIVVTNLYGTVASVEAALVVTHPNTLPLITLLSPTNGS